jgi:hypothetical protein
MRIDKVLKKVINLCENILFSFWELNWKPYRFSLKKGELPNTGLYHPTLVNP